MGSYMGTVFDWEKCSPEAKAFLSHHATLKALHAVLQRARQFAQHMGDGEGEAMVEDYLGEGAKINAQYLRKEFTHDDYTYKLDELLAKASRAFRNRWNDF